MARRERAALVRAAREGDQDAWRALYLRHARRLVVWLASLPLADTAASAEDVAAEAWLTAASKIHQFEGTDDDFAGWLFAIARNHALNKDRTARRRRTDAVPADETSESLFGPATDDLSRVEGQDATRRLLARLSPREAHVVACIDVVGLDVASTAAALGMTTGAVRVARHRALGRLRRILDDGATSGRRPGPHPRA